RGRLVIEAEGDLAERRVGRGRLASTGPPRDRGGRQWPRTHHCRRGLAPTGPPRDRGGRAQGGPQPPGIVSASRGPPRQRGGRPGTGRCWTAIASFNGAAS